MSIDDYLQGYLTQVIYTYPRTPSPSRSRAVASTLHLSSTAAMAPKTKKESTPAPSGAPSSSTSNDSWIATTVVSHYIKNTSQQTKLIDAFMAYLVVVGGIQFLYCVLAGNYVCRRLASLLTLEARVGEMLTPRTAL